MPDIRLNKLLSQCGVSSRRLADDLIRQGRVELNGQVVTELGTKANPERDDVRVDGRRLKTGGDRRYLLMYKPAGVVSTRSDPHRRKTVIDLLATAGIRGYFYPVGRLDYESEGLILLTNDGEFAERVTHPRYEMPRTYEAHVTGVPDDRDLERLRQGILIDGRRTLPAEVRLLRVIESRDGPQAFLQITLREGRNRQVRHMCDAIAHPVERLRRTHIGPLTDRNIKPGQIRDLTPAEVRELMDPAGPARPATTGRRTTMPKPMPPVPRTGTARADSRRSGVRAKAKAPRPARDGSSRDRRTPGHRPSGPLARRPAVGTRGKRDRRS
ncbi:MAG: pseudouridine synthase [Vicinamibacterales bacterium]